MSRILFLIFAFLSVHACAQIIRYDIENAGSDDQFFNPGLLQVNSIRNAAVEFSRKEEGERIENLLKKWIYYFDDKGRVTRMIKIDRPRNVNPDSSFVYLYYHDNGKLRIRRTRNRNVFTGEYFEYDTLGRITKVAVTNENNLGLTDEQFRPAQQQIQFLETYSYERLTNEQEKIKVKNDNGTVYKEGMNYYKSGYLVEKDLRYTITGIRQNEKFEYDSQQRMSRYTYYTDAAGERTESKSFIYDEVTGNLKTQDFFLNGVQTNQVFFFYDKKNLLIEGDVNKELKTGVLHLRNYRFNFSQEVQSPSPR